MLIYLITSLFSISTGGTYSYPNFCPQKGFFPQWRNSDMKTNNLGMVKEIHEISDLFAILDTINLELSTETMLEMFKWICCLGLFWKRTLNFNPTPTNWGLWFRLWSYPHSPRSKSHLIQCGLTSECDACRTFKSLLRADVGQTWSHLSSPFLRNAVKWPWRIKVDI